MASKLQQAKGDRCSGYRWRRLVGEAQRIDSEHDLFRRADQLLG